MHLGVAVLVDPVLGPHPHVLLHRADLHERHVARLGEAADAVPVGVPGEVPDDVLAPRRRPRRTPRCCRGRCRSSRPAALGRVQVPDLVVTEDEHRAARRRRGLVEPAELVTRDLPTARGRPDGVEHGERRARRARSRTARPRRASVGSSIASWLPRTWCSRSPKPRVGVEERAGTPPRCRRT